MVLYYSIDILPAKYRTPLTLYFFYFLHCHCFKPLRLQLSCIFLKVRISLPVYVCLRTRMASAPDSLS